MEEFKFYVLGCRGSRPVSGEQFLEFGGETSCYILRSGEYALILDCGTGLYNAAPYLEECTQIDILMTHLHYDHILGLLNWSVFPKDACIRIYAGVSGDIRDPKYNIDTFLKPPYWPVSPGLGDTICVACDSTVSLTERVSVRFALSNHPDSAMIIRVDTDSGSMCLMSDWEHGGAPVPQEMTEGCSFLLYDGMYEKEEYEMRRGWGHSMWKEGIKLVQERNIPGLVITHHLPERTDEELKKMEMEAGRLFSNIRFARAGDLYSMQPYFVKSYDNLVDSGFAERV